MNKSNASGETVLMLALIRGHSDSVRLLTEAGANVNSHTQTKETALSYALMGRNDDCLKLMIEAGADLWGVRQISRSRRCCELRPK